MRVVAGNGVDDHLLERSVAAAAPAWRPSQLPRAKAQAGGPGQYVLALAKPGGTVELVDADSGEVFWRTSGGSVPDALEWSADGRWLVAFGGRAARLLRTRRPPDPDR